MTVTINGTSGISGVDGSAGTPAIQGGDTNTGMFFPAADTAAIATGGVERMRVDSSGNVGIGTSSPNYKVEMAVTSGANFYSATTSAVGQDVGFRLASTASSGREYRIQTSDPTRGTSGAGLAFVDQTAGAFRMIIDSSGNLGLGDVAVAGVKFYVKSSGSSNATFNTFLRNSASTTLFNIRDDGYITTGTAAVSPYNVTIGSAANLHVLAADGGLYRSTSSIKYKRDVVDYTKGLDAVAALRPVFYKGTNPIEGDTVYAGLIAEEVHEAGLTEFVQYNQEHEPEGLSYGNMVALLTKAIQEQQALITALTARIEALEAK
jgi:hypothetical protein